MQKYIESFLRLYLLYSLLVEVDGSPKECITKTLQSVNTEYKIALVVQET